MANINVIPGSSQGAIIISPLDVSAFKEISVQLTGAWSAKVAFQGSNDNITFLSLQLEDPSVYDEPKLTYGDKNKLYTIEVNFQYFRAVLISYTSGTVTGEAWGIELVAGGGGGGSDATAANQVAGNASLSSIDLKTPALSGGKVPVVGVDLDIRDLDFATDKVDASGSAVSVAGTVTVVATNLDTRDLTFAADKVDASGSTIELGATTLAALETTNVQATNLDIRDLAFATDKVDASGSSVDVANSALPTGASTEAKQDALLTAINAVLKAADTLAAITTIVNPVKIEDNGGSITIDATSLPLPTGASTAANQATEIASLASIDGKLAALDNSKVSVIPSMTAGGNMSAQTAATGTNWTAYGSQALKQLTISNQSGTTIEVRQGGAGVGLQLPTTGIYTFFGITNANQLEIRRVDTSNTQVTITARWEA